VSNVVEGIERARLVRSDSGEKISIHFNPASLEHTISTTVAQKDSGGDPRQHNAQISEKLSFQLVFDTTDTGQDVRALTEQVATLVREKGSPPSVVFEWGLYKFEGILESFRETIDFFSAHGVPLRSTLDLSLAGHKLTPSKEEEKSAAAEVSASGGAAGVAAQGGDPRAARDVAALNGEESLRFSAGASLVVGGSVSLAPPVAFATGGAGGGFGIGGGVSAGVSFGAGASVGSVSAGGGAVFGSRASARVTASEGAFAGLRAPAPGRRLGRLSVARLQPRVETSPLGTDQGASFQLGGQASVQGSASLRADVSGSARLSSRIQFDEDQA
jgi:hypothetical protein